ncbi:hypothetical protein [Vampirovibrio sp.]|uniref:hypothetical protein n=1 Tax=Vampirovibrio sp. TaxID=2717857 RepID=UPI0035946CEE
MKNWQLNLPVSLLGLALMVGTCLPLVAQAQDADTEDYATPAVSNQMGRKMLHLFSSDFPPNMVGQYPTPPVKETLFWQLLDKEMAATSDLTLTDNLENADYRIELRCGGMFHCSKLLVDVKNPDRIVLTSFKLEKFAPLFGLGAPRLGQVARDLSRTLDERIQLLDKGGYGHTD